MNALDANALHALETLQFPAFAVDNDRRVRWQNAAAIALVGDMYGKLDRTIVHESRSATLCAGREPDWASPDSRPTIS